MKLEIHRSNTGSWVVVAKPDTKMQARIIYDSDMSDAPGVYRAEGVQMFLSARPNRAWIAWQYSSAPWNGETDA